MSGSNKNGKPDAGKCTHGVTPRFQLHPLKLRARARTPSLFLIAPAALLRAQPFASLHGHPDVMPLLVASSIALQHTKTILNRLRVDCLAGACLSTPNVANHTATALRSALASLPSAVALPFLLLA